MSSKVAQEYGASLPRFASPRDARRALFADRDRALAHPAVAELARTPESLVALERVWSRTQRGRRALEEAMGFFVGAVAVASAKARWVVRPFAFVDGTYEIGVEVGNTAVMGVDGMCVGFTPAKDGRALAREYRRMFPLPEKRARAPKIDAGMIEATVLALVARRAHPRWKLWVDVRHRLRADKILLRQINAAIAALSERGLVAEQDGRIAAVSCRSASTPRRTGGRRRSRRRRT